METLEALENLEKSIARSRQVISDLIAEAEKWKRMYVELANRLDTGETLPEGESEDCRRLLEENRALKAKLQQVIHRTENIREKVGEILNS